MPKYSSLLFLPSHGYRRQHIRPFALKSDPLFGILVMRPSRPEPHQAASSSAVAASEEQANRKKLEDMKSQTQETSLSWRQVTQIQKQEGDALLSAEQRRERGKRVTNSEGLDKPQHPGTRITRVVESREELGVHMVSL